ncbi:hypothetical protein K8I28_01120, partial [bacterium]|nr:hypothetical protein [bacterium]
DVEMDDPGSLEMENGVEDDTTGNGEGESNYLEHGLLPDVKQRYNGSIRLTSETWDALEHALVLQDDGAASFMEGDTLPSEIVSDSPVTNENSQEPVLTLADIDTSQGIPAGYKVIKVPHEEIIKTGEPSMFYRYNFSTDERVTFAELEITADDKWTLYVNGELIEEDYDEDWSDISFVPLTEFLQRGENLLAVQVDDPDSTGGGFWGRLMYSTIPDIPDDFDFEGMNMPDTSDVEGQQQRQINFEGTGGQMQQELGGDGTGEAGSTNQNSPSMENNLESTDLDTNGFEAMPGDTLQVDPLNTLEEMPVDSLNADPMELLEDSPPDSTQVEEE